VDACRRASEGTTNRVRLKEERFLKQTIPLPPIAEQRRIVSKIERLAGKITEARELRESADIALQRLGVAMAHRSDMSPEQKAEEGWQLVSLSEVIAEERESVAVDPTGHYPNVGLLNFARGVFAKPPILGTSTSAKTLYRIHEKQFIYSRLFAFEGAYAIVPAFADGHYVSNEFPTFNCEESRIEPAFLSAYFTSRRIWDVLSLDSKGMGDRRRRIHPEAILNHRLWLPPIEYQQKITRLSANTTRMDEARRKTILEIEALIPSVLDRAFSGQLMDRNPALPASTGTGDQQLAKHAMVYTVMLLRHWNTSVARNVFDACLALMLNDRARKKILGDNSFQTAPSSQSSGTPFRGLDNLLGEMRVRKAVKIANRNGQQFLSLGKNAPATNNAPPEDKKRLKETLAAFEIVGEDRSADVLADMIDTTYELATT